MNDLDLLPCPSASGHEFLRCVQVKTDDGSPSGESHPFINPRLRLRPVHHPSSDDEVSNGLTGFQEKG